MELFCMRNRKTIIQEWLEKAQGDFESAETLLQKGKASSYDAICFLCQQCIEKLLKAVLTQQEIRPPKSHSLNELSRRVASASSSWCPCEEKLDVLSKYAIDYRYPGYNATREEAQEVFNYCSELQVYIFQFLEQASL